MRRSLAYLVAASVAVSGMLTGTGPASATMAGTVVAPAAKVAERSSPGVEQVQYRGHRRHWRGSRHWRGGRHWRGHRHYSHRRYHRRNSGAAAAAGIIGLGIGAMMGSAMANSRASDWHAYCASKYRSYDPRTGTYLGYDGRRHRCR